MRLRAPAAVLTGQVEFSPHRYQPAACKRRRSRLPFGPPRNVSQTLPCNAID